MRYTRTIHLHHIQIDIRIEMTVCVKVLFLFEYITLLFVNKIKIKKRTMVKNENLL